MSQTRATISLIDWLHGMKPKSNVLNEVQICACYQQILKWTLFKASFWIQMRLFRNNFGLELHVYNLKVYSFLISWLLKIGLRTQKSGGFTWTTDNSSVSSDFMFWCPGQPSNSGGNRLTLAEPCVVAKYTKESFCFDDLNCSFKKRFCCEKNT